MSSSKLINKLKKYKDKLLFNIKYKEVFEDENNINMFIKYVFDIGIGNTYSKVFDIGNNYINFINSIDIKKDNYKRKKLSKKQILEYTKDVLDSIDPELKEEFIKLEKDKTIIFRNRILKLLSNNKNSHFIAYPDKRCKEELKKVLEINNELTFDAVKTMTHEFMHSVTDRELKKIELDNEVKYYKNDNQKIYDEFISIYFEEYAKSFLEKNNSIPKEEFDNTSRINNIYMQGIYKKLYLPFKIFYDYGEYNYKNYKEFVIQNDIDMDSSYEGYINNKNYFLKVYKTLVVGHVEEVKKKEEHPNLFNDHYDEILKITLKTETFDKTEYVLGTMLAFYVKDKVNPKEMLEFSRLINNDNKIELYKNPLYKKIDEMYGEVLDGNFDYNIFLNYLKENDCINKGATL